MGQLIYSTIASLDGYTADRQGKFDWGAPDAEVHSFINDLEREVGTYLFGRRMYAVMSVWEDMGGPADAPQIQDYARIWQAADKTVYSATLDAVTTARTHLEREFRPDDIRRLKDATEGTIGIGGPTLAGAALSAGLVDECRFFIVPVAVGGGLPFLPAGLAASFELLEQRRFASGVLYLRYAVRP